VAALAAAAAAFLVLGGTVAFSRVQAWQQGKLFLTTEGPVLTAELLTDKGDLAVPRFTVPTEEPLAVPAGSYRLRLHGRGLLDETYLVEVERGKEATYEVGLNDQRFGDPIQVPRAFELAAIEGRHDVLLLSESGVSRVNGATGKTIWTTNLKATDKPAPAGRWDWGCLGNIPSGRDAYDHRPHLVQPLVDLDGDGVPDLVWASRRQAALVALSGKDGKVIWCFRAPDSKTPLKPRFQGDSASQGTIVGKPAVVDVDGDGTPDLLITCAAAPSADGSQPRWVEAVSGRSGHSLWRYDLDERWFTPPPSGQVPYDSCWFGEGGMSIGSGGRYGFGEIFESNITRSFGRVAASYAADVARVNGGLVAVVAAGSRLVGLDLQTGKPAWPIHDLGYWPLRAPQHADLDGDGDGDILFLRPTQAAENGGVATDDCLTLVAMALRTRNILWQANIRSRWEWNWYEQPSEWPLVADIDGDGRPEIIVPTGADTDRGKWSGVELLDGATGSVRWQRPLSRIAGWAYGLERVNRLLLGPDLDGDGHREIFTAVIERNSLNPTIAYQDRHVELWVDAVSGKDGHSLWWSRLPIPSSSTFDLRVQAIEPLHWWTPGPDGWAQLLVSFIPAGPQDPRPTSMFFLSAGTGKLQHTLVDFHDAQVADLDGDHLPDLVGYRPHVAGAFDNGGKLEVLRGRSPETWRRLGGFWRPAADLDGDGIPDLLSTTQEVTQTQDLIRQRAGLSRQDSGQLETMAASGRDGHILWHSKLNQIRTGPAQDSSYHQSPSFPAGAGRTAGQEQVLYARDAMTHRIAAFSASTGNRLWSATLPIENWQGPNLLATEHLEHQRSPQTLFAFAVELVSNPRVGVNTVGWQNWLAVLEGNTGRVRWKQPLCEPQAQRKDYRTPFAYLLSDVDGDGVLDVIVEAGEPNADGEVRAFSGRDGALLWRWAPAPRSLDQGAFSPSRPTMALADWDGNGKPDVVVLHQSTKSDKRGRPVPHAEVVLLDRTTGRPRWSWQEPVDSSFNQPSHQRVPSMEAPLAVTLNGRQRAICIWTSSHEAQDQIFLLDAEGKVIQRRPLRFRVNEEDLARDLKEPRLYYAACAFGSFEVSNQDLDNDGGDELVFLTQDKLVVTHNGLDHVLWEWPLPDAACALVGFLPVQDNRAATLVLQAGEAIHGFAGPSGKPLWGCVGPGILRAMLPSSDATALPSFVFDLGKETTVCRRALSVGPTGDDLPASGFQPFADSHQEDPRLARLLPWSVPVGSGKLPSLMATPSGICFSSMAVSLGMVVLPVALLRWMVRRRQWTLGFLAFLWVDLFWAGAYGLYLLQWPQEADRAGHLKLATLVFLGLLAIAIVGMPLTAFLRLTIGLIREKRWSRLSALMSAAGAMAAGVAWIILRYVADPLFPDQHYAWNGWYTIWPAGVYVVGALIVGMYVVRGGIRWSAWLARRLLRRAQPA
jgi:outer membrane protein assembly factor BamB